MRVASFWIALIAVAMLLESPRSRAGDPQLAGDILPLLKARCVKCHGPAKQEAKLNLSTPGGLARGGESGELVASANPAGSLLWQRVEADEMPPDDPLPAEEKAAIKQWIASGAVGLPAFPSGAPPASDHWAFDRLKSPSAPAIADPAIAPSAIDRFLAARLEQKALTPHGEADRATLIRRVSFDLTGLPPTPEEIEAFQSDPSATAYDAMVERYLASPHYGERWGKYWLDAAGYADSNGYFNADTDRPLAYRYRDYVVRALNEDKPFDRFVVEQLAGDELARFTTGPGGHARNHLPARSDALFAQRAGRLRRKRRQRRGGSRRPLLRAGVGDADRGLVAAGADHAMRQVPRSQVRADFAARLLPPAVRLLSGLRHSKLAQAQRAVRLRAPAGRVGAVGGPRPANDRGNRRAESRV